MDIQTQILDAVLKKYGKPDKELFSSLENVNEEAFKEELKKLHLLNYTQRDLFFWELQNLVEKCISEHGGSDDNERLAEIVVGRWNQTKEPKVNQSVVLSFFYIIHLKFLNSQKSFMAVCDGDLQSYKTFNSKPRLFLDLLIRFLTCINGRQNNNHIVRILEDVVPLLFEGTSRTDYKDALVRLGFQTRKGLVYGKMNAYRRHVGVENLVYAEGMRTILVEALTNAEGEMLALVKERLNSMIEKEEQSDDSEETFEVDDLLEEHISEVHTPSSLEPRKEANPPLPENQDPSHEQQNDPDESYIVGGVGERKEKEEQKPETAELKNELVSLLEHALSAVQSALNQASQYTKQQSAQIETVPQSEMKSERLAVAEEEINRLKLALQQEKEKVAQAEEKAYQKVLQAIGGENSNYLLSDLFEESQGKLPDNPNISAGRLINLFSSLSLAIGLEEHSNGYELGDTFSVHKDELIKNYCIDGPVANQGDHIQVKLLKYGWAINGKVIIQPLVTELKEEV